MRKVKFNKWQKRLWDLDPNAENSGVLYSDAKPDSFKYPYAFMMKQAGYEEDFPNEGYFHCWSSLQQSPLAVIEDYEGLLYEIPTQHIHFITPPEDDIKIEQTPIDEVKLYGINDKGNKSFDINQIMKTEDK